MKSPAMADYLPTYWPQIFFVLSIVLGVPAAIHATMTKEEVRAAIGWVGVIILSPVIGAVIYAVAGINRIRRSSISSQRAFLHEIGQDHLHALRCERGNISLRISRSDLSQ